MNCVARKMVVLVGNGGAANRKRSEPHGRHQVAIYLGAREWSKPSRRCKNAGAERDKSLGSDLPMSCFGSSGVDILYANAMEGRLPKNESQERKVRKGA